MTPVVRHPRLVIAVPVYDEARFLPETLRSIEWQTDGDFAVLISDNCSTDSTRNIAEAAAARDPRITYVRQPDNLGSCGNFNWAREASDSPCLLWLGGHDLLNPAFVAHHLALLDGRPDVVVSQSWHSWIDEEGQIAETICDGDLDWGSPDSAERFLASVSANRNNIAANSVIRRSALDGLSFGNFVGTDRVLLSELAYRGRFATTPDVLYMRRTFASRDNFGDYMKRLTGSGEARESWGEFARQFVAAFEALVNRPLTVREWVELEVRLRYHFPVERGSLATEILWALRRAVKLLRLAMGRRDSGVIAQ